MDDHECSTGTAVAISIVVTFIITLIVTALVSVVITSLCYFKCLNNGQFKFPRCEDPLYSLRRNRNPLQADNDESLPVCVNRSVVEQSDNTIYATTSA